MHLTVTHLTGMVHILRAVSVCELNEVFQELNIYLYLKLLKYVFHNLSNSSLIYPTSPVSAGISREGEDEWFAKMVANCNIWTKFYKNHVMLKSFFFRSSSSSNAYFRLDYRGNGYKFSAGRFLESFGGTTITYDGLKVLLNAIDQS